MDAKQQEIDFTRASQLAMIRDAELPLVSVAGARVSPDKLKLILMTLDHFCRGGEGWPMQPALVAASNASRRTVQRCVKALHELGLIVIELKWNAEANKVINHYRIVWSELALLTPNHRSEKAQTDAPPMAHRSADNPPDRCATTADRCATCADRCANGGASIEPVRTVRTVIQDQDLEEEDQDLELLEWCEKSPTLKRAKAIVIPPAPANLGSALKWSVFKTISDKHLGDMAQMVIWWRCQLTANAPVTGGTKAELLLVLAAAKRAMSMSSGEVRTTRAAVFKGIVSKRSWHRVMPYVDEVADTVDDVLDDVADYFQRKEAPT